MDTNLIRIIESEIDLDFSNSPLNNVNYSQSLWTILSFVEDMHLKMNQIKPLEYEYQHVQADVLMNAINHPVRSIYKNNSHAPKFLVHEVIDDHYGWAHEWIDKAVVYDNFCSIFPLFWKKKISI